MLSFPVFVSQNPPIFPYPSFLRPLLGPATLSLPRKTRATSATHPLAAPRTAIFPGINTCKTVSKQTTSTPFRMNTYGKPRGAGVSLTSLAASRRTPAAGSQSPLLHDFLASLRPILISLKQIRLLACDAIPQRLKLEPSNHRQTHL